MREHSYLCLMKKSDKLGMPHGTASNRLKKMILFNLLQKTNSNFCFRCGGEIETADELSIEHKVGWITSDNPIEKFFDLDNIAFSHLSCNCENGGKFKKGIKHPSHRAYNEGCRCDECKAIQAERRRKQRKQSLMA